MSTTEVMVDAGRLWVEWDMVEQDTGCWWVGIGSTQEEEVGRIALKVRGHRKEDVAEDRMSNHWHL